MKVVVVAPYAGRGVFQPHLDKLLPALRRRNYEVEFVGWDRASQWPRRFDHDGISYRMVLRGGGYSSRRLLAFMPVWCLLAAVALRRRARGGDEVVMAIDFEGAAPAAVAHLLGGRKFIYNCRDNVSMRYRLPRLLKALLDGIDARVMARADSVVFPDRSRIPSWAPAHSVVVQNSAPEVEITRSPDPARLTVYACGNLRGDRGVGLLLDAAAEIDGCFVLAAGKCRDPRLAERLASTPNVDYRGELTPAAALELCGEADVVLTFYEPGLEINRRAISNKWSDAMMAGRPILINVEVEKAAWVQEQGIGYACAYDKDALVGMLRRIAEDRVDAAARGARGRKLWEQGYRWDVAEQQLVRLIEQAASARRVPPAPAPA